MTGVMYHDETIQTGRSTTRMREKWDGHREDLITAPRRGLVSRRVVISVRSVRLAYTLRQRTNATILHVNPNINSIQRNKST